MTEAATLHVRLLPEAAMARTLAIAGTAGIAAIVGGIALGIPWWLTAIAVAVALVVFVRRGVYDGAYEVDASGLTRRLVPVGGGSTLERHWDWPAVMAFSLEQERDGRSVLLVRLAGGARLRLREPLDAGGRDAHARFVDRFVGYATGDVLPSGAPGRERPRPEEMRPRPMTSGEAPQLRRTMAHAVAVPGHGASVPWYDRPAGRALTALVALDVLGFATYVAWHGSAWHPWSRLALILVPGGLWLAWRAVRGSRQL